MGGAPLTAYDKGPRLALAPAQPAFLGQLSVRSLARTTPYSRDNTRATRQHQRDCVSAGKTAAVSPLVVVMHQ